MSPNRKPTPYLNDYNLDHFVPPRQYKPGLSKPDETDKRADTIVLIVTLFLALTSLAYAWYDAGAL
jgi:hypothetical protein